MPLSACELMTSIACPNNCVYCYLPKGPAIVRAHRQLIAEIDAGLFLLTLSRIGGDITEFGLWGAEPITTLAFVKSYISDLKRVCPQLKIIQFSTSLISWKPIVSFAREVAKNGLELKIQLSLDGPAFITDKNRFPGASSIVPENFLSLVRTIQDIDGKINFHWKSTLTGQNVETMALDPDRVMEYVDYFNWIDAEFHVLNKNPKVTLDHGSQAPTLAVPGRYTTQDGKNFAEFLRLLSQRDACSAYSYRLRTTLRNWPNWYRRNSITCSAGKTNAGLASGKLHLCHRTFSYDDPEVIDLIIECRNWEFTQYNKSALEMIQKFFIVDPNDGVAMARREYVLSNYHNFWRLSLATTRSQMVELARAGQIDKELVEDDEKCELFAVLMLCVFGCPAESLITIGTMHVIHMSCIRMFGNGAFQEITRNLNGVLWK